VEADKRYTMDAAAFAEKLPTAQGRTRGVHCVVTDPPWSISTSDLFRKSAPYALQATPDIAAVFRALAKKCIRGAHAYVFLPSGEVLDEALVELTGAGWTFLRMVVWDKAPWGGGGLAGGAWRNSFEPVGIFSNGPPRPYQRGKQWTTTLRQRSHFTRTAKPPSLYRIFLEASTAPGELAVDPWCGLNPLGAAASQEPRRRWVSNDILTPEQVLSQARRKA
jgi:DNA modification methylase